MEDKLMLQTSLSIHHTDVRVIGNKQDLRVVIADVFDWANKEGAVQRPQLRSVLLLKGIRGKGREDYSYRSIFGNMGGDFCSGHAQVVPIDFVEPFLSLCGIEADAIQHFSSTLLEKWAERLAREKDHHSANDSSVPDETKISILIRMVNEMRKRETIVDRRLDALEKSVDVAYDKLLKCEIELRRKGNPEQAAEIRKAASMLYARSKQLEA